MIETDSRYRIIEQAIINVNTCRYKVTMHNGQCKYLNSGLLMAPRKYILHSLVLGIDWTPFWPLLMSMHLVATPNSVSNCLWRWFKFHPNVSCYLGGFSLMYNVLINITTTIHDTGHMYIHHTSITIHILLLFTPLPFSWASWLSSIPFICYSYPPQDPFFSYISLPD